MLQRLVPAQAVDELESIGPTTPANSTTTDKDQRANELAEGIDRRNVVNDTRIGIAIYSNRQNAFV